MVALQIDTSLQEQSKERQYVWLAAADKKQNSWKPSQLIFVLSKTEAKCINTLKEDWQSLQIDTSLREQSKESKSERQHVWAAADNRETWRRKNQDEDALGNIEQQQDFVILELVASFKVGVHLLRKILLEPQL